MVSFTRFVGWCLVGIFGLIFSPFSYAQAPGIYPTDSVAQNYCTQYFLNAKEKILTYSGGGTQVVYRSPGDCTVRVSSPVLPNFPNRGYFSCSIIAQRTSTSGAVNYYRYSCASTVAGSNPTIYTKAQADAATISDSAALKWYSDNSQTCTVKTVTSYTRRADTPNGSGDVCDDGCSASVAIEYLGVYPKGRLVFYFDYDGTTCDGPDNITDDPLINDADGDGIEDKNDKCPNDPTNKCDIPDDSKDTDGDGIPDHKDPYPNDPDNGKDDGSGNESDNTASGGGTCVTPPTCSGDAIQCNQLYQLWSIRCGKGPDSGGAGQPGTAVGGTTDVTPVVNAVEDVDQSVKDLNQDFKDFVGDGSGEFVVGDIKQERSISTDSLDTSGFGFPRACSFTPISIPVGNTSMNIDFGSTGACTIFTWTGYLVVALASFLGVFILIRL